MQDVALQFSILNIPTQSSVLNPSFDLDSLGRYLSRVNESHQPEEGLEVDNTEVARVLQQIADMLEFKNENPFKFRSYQMAAETIGSMANETIARP